MMMNCFCGMVDWRNTLVLFPTGTFKKGLWNTRFSLKYTSFIFTNLARSKLIGKLCKSLKIFFIAAFDAPCLMYVCESYDKS